MGCGTITPISCHASDGNTKGRIIPIDGQESDSSQEHRLNKAWKKTRWMSIDTRPLPFNTKEFSTIGVSFTLGPASPGASSVYTLNTTVLIPPAMSVIPTEETAQYIATGTAPDASTPATHFGALEFNDTQNSMLIPLL
jgi:hypothetical protein